MPPQPAHTRAIAAPISPRHRAVPRGVFCGPRIKPCMLGVWRRGPGSWELPPAQRWLRQIWRLSARTANGRRPPHGASGNVEEGGPRPPQAEVPSRLERGGDPDDARTLSRFLDRRTARCSARRRPTDAQGSRRDHKTRQGWVHKNHHKLCS